MKDFLVKLEKNNIRLKLEDTSLSVKYPKEGIDVSLLEEIKSRKSDLLSYLISLEKNEHAGIPALQPQESYPVSSSQKRLWILSQLEETNIAYNIPSSYLIEGNLNIYALERAFKDVLQRHEILRTVFREDAGETVRQYVLSPEELNFSIVFEDFSDQQDQLEKVESSIRRIVLLPFDLSEGPLLRVRILKLDGNNHIIFYVLHHIITDGWSMELMKKELLTLYAAFVNKTNHSLAPLRIQYRDYAAWQQQQLLEESILPHKKYWLDLFSGELPVLDLLTDKIRPKVRSYNGGMIRRTFDEDIAVGIKQLGQSHGATLYMTVLAGVKALLYGYTGQEDIVIGTAISGREHADLEDQIGFYLNTLPLRTRFRGEGSFIDLLNIVKEVTLGAYEHQVYPFDELVNALALKRDMSRNVLFDVMVDLLNTGKNKMNIGEFNKPGIHATKYDPAVSAISRFDLTFYFEDRESEWGVTVEYNGDLFDERYVEQLITHLEQLFRALIQSPLTSLNKLNFLSEKEIRGLLYEFNDTAVTYPVDKTISDLFERQAAATPDYIALAADGRRITYGELNERSNQLAGYLISTYEITSGDRIGISLDRSEWLITAILGVMKAGAAYVPIDPAYPKDRILYMTSDSSCKLIIDEDELAAFNSIRSKFGKNNRDAVNKPDHLAYVLYTSGSTGRPKGVMIEHRSVVNYVTWALATYVRNDANHNFGLFTSLSFDLTVTSIYVPLLSGGTLQIYSSSKALPEILAEYTGEKGIAELIKLTPSHIDLLQDPPVGKSCLKKVIAGGESLMPFHVDTLNKLFPGIEIYNEYGPTETTVGSICWKVDKDGRTILIGKPIGNTQIYLLNSGAQLVPIGVRGEIYIGGAGLARGYWNNPDLTAEKFVMNPFRPGEMLYRTGDHGRWLPDGNIEFAGRKDQQIKIRGHRVELGEIERMLSQHGKIRAVTVLAKADSNGNKSLIAYLTGMEPLNADELKSYLMQSLPYYMIPSRFVQMKELPLTANGKVDQEALPDPDGAGMAGNVQYIAPRNELEKNMAGIWEAILMKKRIGVRDSFFELGGDSIKILRMMSELRKKTGIELPMGAIYKYNTIEGLSIYTSEHSAEITGWKVKRAAEERIVREEIGRVKETVLLSGLIGDKVEIEDVYPMSDIEKAMVYEYLAKKGVYHDQMVHYRTIDDFDLDRFKQALALVVEKHAILRTSFNLSDYEQEIQLVYRNSGVNVPYYDLSHLVNEEQKIEIDKFLTAEVENALVFYKAPLWRMNVFGLGKDRYVFIFQCHHAIIDGWSDASFNTELNNIYIKLKADPDYRPHPLRADYKDFVISELINKKNEALKSFWKKEMQAYERLELFSNEEQFSFQAFSYDSAFIEKVKITADHLNTTVKAISLSAYLYLLSILDGKKEFATGLVTNTRPDCEDGDKILGCFLNTIPFKIKIEDATTGSRLIDLVSAKLIELKEFESLCLFDIFQTQQAGSRPGNVFFDETFTFTDFHAYEGMEGSASSNSDPQDISYVRSRIYNYFDFSIDLTGNRFKAMLSATRKFKPHFAAGNILGLYFRILQHLMTNPEQAISLSLGTETTTAIAVIEGPTISPGSGTIVDLFREQVLKTPAAIALVVNGTELTYRELARHSNRLSAYLRSEYDITADDRIGIMLPRSEWMVIAIMAILKSGAAYLPIDGTYPETRISTLLTDGNCKIVVDEALILKFRQQEEIYDESDPEIKIEPGHLAYVMYTSGSTGQPKGVMIEHHSLNAFICYCKTEFMNSCVDTVMSGTSISFDLSVFEIFYSLTSGKKLYLVDHPLAIGRALLNQKNVLINTVPTVIGALLEDNVDFSGVTVLNMAGEDIPGRYLQLLDCNRIEVRNLYGPTECTVYSTLYRIGANGTIAIGRPISNTQIYIFTDDGNLVCGHEAGNICISGEGLARGYLNRPDLTAEVFVNNPLRPGQRMYKTGDIGRLMPDGNLQFLGRKDSQVKIRGYRVEIGEVENALRGIEGIARAAVVAKKDPVYQTQRLVAYIVTSSTLSQSEVRLQLQRSLPEYMLPEQFIETLELPVTETGKIDKKALSNRDTEISRPGIIYVPAANPIEEKLIGIWEKLLGRKNIGRNDDFFLLGGHSLKAARLLPKIEQIFGTHLYLKDIFSYRILESMALAIADDQERKPCCLIALQEKAVPAYRNVYFIPPMAGNPAIYLPIAEEISKECNSYGLKYSGLEDGEYFFDSIKDAAVRFCSLITMQQEQDDFILFAYSMGVHIAFEMAKILETKFNSFTLLFVDTGVIQPTKNGRNTFAITGHKETDVIMNSRRMLLEYIQEGKIHNPIITFQARNNSIQTNTEEWKNWTDGHCRTEYIDGDHWTALSATNTGKYADVIRSIIQNKTHEKY